MCYHKSTVAKFSELVEYYNSSLHTAFEDLKSLQERFDVLMSKNKEPYTKEETQELLWLQKTLRSFKEDRFHRFHENGFDFLPSPIITVGAPNEFKMMRWGLVPFFMKEKEKAMQLRLSTLNCISEEMYDKSSYKDASKNAQRCLIPVTGFYEWRWLDEKGKTKIPYYVSLKNQAIASIGGLYSRWKDPATNEYYYSYTVCTTQANEMMSYIHNNKKRMPVIIPKQYEQDWLNKALSKDDVLALCQPFKSDDMKAHTISKLITTKGADTNADDEVLRLHNYEKVGTDELITQIN